MFFASDDFPFTDVLQTNWLTVRSEFLALDAANFMAWPERFLYDNRWDVFGLYAFGRKLVKNCDLCPKTTALVESIPGLTTAGFSSLRARTRIMPHTGYSSRVLRCHLGLVVPDGCGIRVGCEERHWRPGECLIFDDTVEHEAWNASDQDRAVLLIDFDKAGITASESPYRSGTHS